MKNTNERNQKPINSLHTSISKSGLPPRPFNMSRILIDSETRETIESIALSIFTDMVNSGASLQATLAAIYISGSENAIQALKDIADNEYHQHDMDKS